MFFKTRQLIAACITLVALLVPTGCNNAPTPTKSPAASSKADATQSGGQEEVESDGSGTTGSAGSGSATR